MFSVGGGAHLKFMSDFLELGTSWERPCMLVFTYDSVLGCIIELFFREEVVFPSRSAAKILWCMGMFLLSGVCYHGDVGTRRGGSVSE